jgi:hypothetical protein
MGYTVWLLVWPWYLTDTGWSKTNSGKYYNSGRTWYFGRVGNLRKTFREHEHEHEYLQDPENKTNLILDGDCSDIGFFLYQNKRSLV